MLESNRGYYTSEETHYEFGPYRLYPSEQLLLRDNVPIPLAPKAFDLLVALIASHGHLVTREALMQTVWPDSFVEETNITANISLLRKILAEMPNGCPWIATVPKRGYRFDGPVIVHFAPNTASGSVNPGPSGDTPATVGNTSEAPAAPENLPLTPSTPDRKTDTTRDPVSGSAATVPVHPTRPPKPFAIPFAPGLPRVWLITLAAAVLLVLSLGIAALFIHHRSAEQLASVHSIAVLPFQSGDTGTADQFLGLGLTDALITRLGRLSQIEVRPIGAVRSLTGAYDPLSAGRQLNVQAVLEGTVQRVGDHTKVAVHLQRVSDGSSLWSENFDEQTSSDFEIEDSISQRLAKALTLHLSQEQQRQLGTPNTPNPKAYELYTQGRYYWNKRTVESVQKSIDLFREATTLDPNYAAAWSGLADAWILAGSYGNSFLAPSVAMPKAKEAAEKALSLDDSSAEAHTSLAYIHLTWDWDFTAAEQEFKRALQINPDYVNAHHWYSHELVALGRLSESHEQSEAALALDPTDVVINEHMAWHHLMAREYNRSLPQAIKSVELDPSFVQAHRVLGLGLLYTGRSKEACDEFEKGVVLSHGDPVANAYLARCYALTHRGAEAHKILPALEQAATERYISAAEIAAVYAALNDSESAFKWLDKACDEHAGALIYLNADRIWDPLRSNPRFLAELKRVNLLALADESPAH